MSLRLKVVVALVALVAAATVAIGVFSYRTTRDELLGQIDSSLQSTAQQVQRPGGVDQVLGPRTRGSFRSAGDVVVQVIEADGSVYRLQDDVTLPVDSDDVALAAGDAQRSRLRISSTDDGPYRMLTTSLGDARGAVQAGRSLTEMNDVLAALRTRILVASLVVIVAAALVGALLARQLTRRLIRLTSAAEEVRGTGRLDVAVPLDGSDETARLAAAFQEMLATLARSKDDQQRLVQDAGHELRTPLTSLRTNVYLLRRSGGPGAQMDDAARLRVLDDLDSESQELSRLVEEVVEVATDRRGDEAPHDVELGALVERVSQRAAQRSGRPVLVHLLEPATVTARPLALERAVANLVENALKFDDGDGPIEVTCEGGRVEVADRGPGIAAEDRERVFDRFFRSTEARSRPGSGLGLSIVSDVVQRHGGRVFAAARAGGGAIVGFVLPVEQPRPQPSTPQTSG